MDPVTHLAAGALGGRLAQSRFDKGRLFWFCVVAAWLPDIDNVMGFFGPEFYLLYHRGITHSFFGGLAEALLLAAVFRLFSRDFPFALGVVIGYACIAAHIFLDLITSYGTLIFSPLTTARYTMNSVFIVDPIFTVVMILCLLSSRLWKKYANRIAAAGLAWVLIYPLLCFGVNRGVARYYAGRLDKEGMPVQRFELTTELFSPFLWRLVVEDEKHYHLAGINLLDLGRELKFESYLKPPPELVGTLEKKISMLRTFLWFAKYPVMEKASHSEETRLLFNDLRFFSTVGLLKNASGNNEHAPFALVIELDSDGTPLNWQYRRPRGTVVIHHLE